MGDAPMDEAPDIIVFGTLEKTAQQADGVALGVAAGNIHKADETEHMELTQVRARHARTGAYRRSRARSGSPQDVVGTRQARWRELTRPRCGA
jgi:hypothetical protein